jgi:glycerol kinase
MQFQSDLLDVEIDRPTNIETTALGAAYLAGLATRVFANHDAIRSAHKLDKTWTPSMSSGDRTQHLARWQDAVARARSHASSQYGES